MVNITDEDWNSKEYTSSNAINSKPIPKEDIKEKNKLL
jgi:hypothetical protein